MIKSTFKVTFFVKRNALRRDGTAPIVSRITINGKTVQFSTKLHIKPSMRSTKFGKASGQTTSAKEINTLLDDIKSRVNKIYHQLTIHDEHITSEKVKNEFLGLNTGYKTVLSVFDKHNEDFKKLVGVSKVKATYNKYIVTRRYVADFINLNYNVSDMALREINYTFLENLSIYLQTQRKCNINSAGKHLQRLKKIVFIAKSNGWIKADPFINFKIRLKKVDRGYLT
ncbi:MAG: phage integrase SAM-like domain and Arm DNA-binding domain-containing protein [Bacteroidales bacterium]